MLGIIEITSIVVLICLSIAQLGRSAECLIANCAECATYSSKCTKCEDGYYMKARLITDTCKKEGSCFPGTAMVTTQTGNVAMETLNIGDLVLTEIGNKQLGFTKVVGFAQRQPGIEGHFLSITAVNQVGHTQTVKLTATHNIYVKSKRADGHDDYIPRFAAHVLIGDMLKIQTDNGTDEATVTHVTLHKEMGVYNPLTETGTMLVDGTLVSCYASINDYLVHLVLAPIRWFPWLFAEAIPLDGTLPYVETLKYIARSYVAPIVSIN